VRLFGKTYNQKTDEELAVLLSKGQEPAFDELYKRYAERMYHFFYKMLHQDEAKALDFCQNLFLKLFEKAASFDSKMKFSTWLYTIASNMCKNEYRRLSRREPLVLREAMRRLEPKAPGKLDGDIFQRHLQVAINKLDEKHKTCFVLRYQEEKTIAEISTLLGCPQGTVKSRLHYTLKRLAAELHHFDPKQKRIRK